MGLYEMENGLWGRGGIGAFLGPITIGWRRKRRQKKQLSREEIQQREQLDRMIEHNRLQTQRWFIGR